MSYKNPQPHRHVPDTQPSDPELRTGDPLGSFVGYLRRPKSSMAGLVAQFFGENGADADVIAALHLTRFLDANVKVTVWMMKDRVGRIMKRNGQYTKLTEFIATIKRPLPNNNGQVAQFFGENGANSDAINVLNQSQYLDALVFVEMHQAETGMTVADLVTDTPDAELDVHGQRMTPTEAQDFKKLQKRSQEAMNILRTSGFFRNESVLAVLGREQDFEAWTQAQLCCHPGSAPCDGHPVVPWAVPGVLRHKVIPLCAEHVAQWTDGTAETADGSNPLSFAIAQRLTNVQRWAMFALNKALNIPPDRMPTAGAVFAWAVDKKLHTLIPASFKAFLS